MIHNRIILGYTAGQMEAMMQQKVEKYVFYFEINSCLIFENSEAEAVINMANLSYGSYSIEVIIKLDEQG